MAMAKGKACPKKNMVKVMEFLQSVQWHSNIVIFVDTHADPNTGYLQHQGGADKRSNSVDNVSDHWCLEYIYTFPEKTNLFPDLIGLSWARIHGKAQSLSGTEAPDHPVLWPLDD